ncbi:MAG: hypothetical protein LBM78_01500, partial [Clostridiales bacterium]|nr:hypothetical protein [Clostridiales bacterium]
LRIYDGAKQYVNPSKSVPGFQFNQAFALRVVVAGNTVSVFANGTSLAVVKLDSTTNEGYVSVHGGALPVTVSGLRIIELPGAASRDDQPIEFANDVRIAVPFNTAKADLITALPGTAEVKDAAGITRSVAVDWDVSAFDGTEEGWAVISGSFTNLPEGLINSNGINASAKVYVQADKSGLLAAITAAEAVTLGLYTPESESALADKLSTARGVYGNEYATAEAISLAAEALNAAKDALTLRTFAVTATDCTYAGTPQAGNTITLTAGTPPKGKLFNYFTVNGEKIDGDTFVMPSSDVTVAAVWKQKSGCQNAAAIVAAALATVLLTITLRKKP